MSVMFTEGDKKIELSIFDYEFAAKKGMNEYDSNWLTVAIEYFDGVEHHSYTDNCLLADELESIVKNMKDILSGKETGMIADFIEPYLELAVTKVDDIYAMQIRFVYDTSDDWKEIYVSQGLTEEMYQGVCSDIEKMSKQFPVRNNR
ncbi:MAG: hypothetical protein LUH57_01830 [Ruminococcus sp.]|nr:hypothetical protein [Ruminococcus sp.]